MVKDLSSPKPANIYMPEYSAWRERVSGVTMDRLRELFVYDDSNPGAPLVRINHRGGRQLHEGRTINRYRRTMVGGTTYSTARLVYIFFHGPIPDDMEIDHINRDSQDNRVENIRLVSRSDNQRNTRTYGKSTYRGVAWAARNGKWQARLKVAGRQVFLGYFDSEQEAAAAFDAGMRLFHGHDHQHPSNTSEGLIDQSQVDHLPIGSIYPLRKHFGITRAQWAEAKQAHRASEIPAAE